MQLFWSQRLAHFAKVTVFGNGSVEGRGWGSCGCGKVDVEVNNLSVVGHIGIGSIRTFLHNKKNQFEILFGLYAPAVPKGHGIATLRIMKMIFKTTRLSVNYAKDWLGQLFLIPDLVWSGKCSLFREGSRYDKVTVNSKQLAILDEISQ